MPLQLTCPTCGAKLRASDKAIGKSLPCPKCSSPITAQRVAPSAPPQPAPVSPPPPPPMSSSKSRVVIVSSLVALGLLAAVALYLLLNQPGASQEHQDPSAPSHQASKQDNPPSAPTLIAGNEPPPVSDENEQPATSPPTAIIPQAPLEQAIDEAPALAVDQGIEIEAQTRVDEAAREFDQAALWSTLRYWTDINEVKAFDPDAPVRLLTGATLLRNSQSPVVQECGKGLDQGRLWAEREVQKVLDQVGASNERADAILAHAVEGSLSSAEEHVSVGQDRHGNTRFLTSSTDNSDAVFAFALSKSVAILQGMMAPAVIEGKIAECMRAAQPLAWRALLGGASARYAGVPAAARMIEPILVANAKGELVYALRNTSGSDLTNVFVHCDLFHFKTVPFCEVTQVVAVEHWPKDQTVYVTRTLTKNLALNQAQIDRIARPSNVEPSRSDFADVRRLEGLAGLVSVDIAAWSDQGVMAGTIHRFDDQAIACARFDLPCMMALANRHKWSANSIERILQFAPEGSEEARMAMALRDDPERALAEWKSNRTDAFLKHVPRGAVFEGTMRYRVKKWDRPESDPRTHFAPSPGGMMALRTVRSYERHGHTENWTLTILRHDENSGRITAVATSDGPSRTKRQFEGVIDPLAAPYAVLVLEPSPQKNRTASEVEEIGKDMLSGRFDLVLWLDADGSLKGHSAKHLTFADEFGYVFELQPKR